jgi:hypothetical protein
MSDEKTLELTPFQRRQMLIRMDSLLQNVGIAMTQEQKDRLEFKLSQPLELTKIDIETNTILGSGVPEQKYPDKGQCPACGHDGFRKENSGWSDGPDDYLTTCDGWSFEQNYECPECGHKIMVPFSADMDYYDEDPEGTLDDRECELEELGKETG